MSSFPAKLQEAEARISTLEDQMTAVMEEAKLAIKSKQALENKLEELENHSRRSNLCIVEFPEGLEGLQPLQWVNFY